MSGGPGARAAMEAPPLAAYLSLAASMLIAGLCVTIGKAALAYLPVVALAGPRCLAAITFLLPFAWAERRRGPTIGAILAGMGVRERFDLVAQAFFGIFAFTLLMLGGVRLTGAGEAGLIAATMPLAILVLALPLLGEPLRARSVGAAAIASIGIAVITFSGGVGEGGARWLGNGLVALAVVAEALYTIFAKRLATRLPPATMAVMLNVVGLALFAPLLAFQPWGKLLASVPAWGWLLGATYGALTSGLALVLWYRGARRVPGATAGLFTVFLPVGALVSGVAFLGETIDGRQIAGGAVIAVALAVGLWRPGGARTVPAGRGAGAAPTPRPRA